MENRSSYARIEWVDLVYKPTQNYREIFRMGWEDYNTFVAPLSEGLSSFLCKGKNRPAGNDSIKKVIFLNSKVYCALMSEIENQGVIMGDRNPKGIHYLSLPSNIATEMSSSEARLNTLGLEKVLVADADPGVSKLRQSESGALINEWKKWD
jgi:hypothetical protein